MNEGSLGRDGVRLCVRGGLVAADWGWRLGAVIPVVLALGLLGGCASRGDGRALGGGPGGSDWSEIPDAVPRVEPLSKSGNPESYQVRGRRYYTQKTSAGHVERGLASWYGKQFHGRKTSSGERYDMYAMTAAHKTLPLPSYVRVTNMENGRTAVVKVNDRGPFHGPRVIDLSYSAAKKLGVVQKGTAMVELRALDPARPGAEPGPFLAAKGTAKARPGRPAAPAARAPEVLPAPESAPALAAASPAAPRGDLEVPAPVGTPRPTSEPGPGSALAAVEPAPPESPTTPSVAQARPKAKPPTTSDPGRGLYLQVGAFGDPKNAERLRQRLVANLRQQVRVQHSASGDSALYKVRIGPFGSEGEAKVISAKLETLGVEPPRRVWN